MMLKMTGTPFVFIFFTGITGQDGSYLADFLLQKGYIVHGIVRRASQPNTQRIEHLYADRKTHKEGSMHLHYGDLTDSTCLVKIISQVRQLYRGNVALKIISVLSLTHHTV